VQTHADASIRLLAVDDAFQTSAEASYRNVTTGVRVSFGADSDRALAYYTELTGFISALCPADARPDKVRLLDVGCGSGWSTFAFARSGYDATGIDLNANAFEPAPGHGLTLREGSATDIPFHSNSFDVVVSYQCIEHVPNPQKALDEMSRVCKPRGIAAIVGPNLISPATGIVEILKPSHWRTMPFRRRPGMPRHPYGNTLPETLAITTVRAFQLLGKLLSPAPHPTMRQPDLVPPFHADNDACYLCNPVDLIKYFRRRGFSIEQRGKPGRPPLSYLFARGTWVAARKSET
jgi:SAM-dependent methyltransferase